MFIQMRANFGGIQKIASLGGRVACFDLCGDLIAVLSKPDLLFMEHLHRTFQEFIRGLIRSLFHILLNQGFQFRFELDCHCTQRNRAANYACSSRPSTRCFSGRISS